MGGAVSAGHSNEELVDNLCYEGYINEPSVEQVFRQVDRSDYMVFEEGDDPLEAYEDHAWRKGTLHLSAPCIYSKAMEALKLKRGVSFLNIGSGTGYLSTMAGLILGPYGINHGIELHQENVDYASKKLTEFHSNSPWYDPVEFCEPSFTVGNGLLVSPGNVLYDRIYCGAGCPPEHAQLMKNMINVGGLLVMPLENELECIHRTGETEWEVDVILPSVSFASLILPSEKSVQQLDALEIPVQPHSLKELSRLVILQYLGRSNYHRVSELPIPQHLKDYVSYYREWSQPQEAPKALCPIDHSKERPEREKGEESSENGACGHGPVRNEPSIVQAVDMHGQPILLCTFNGITFQLPMGNEGSDSSDQEEDAGSDGDRDSEPTEEAGMDTDEELSEDDSKEDDTT